MPRAKGLDLAPHEHKPESELTADEWENRAYAARAESRKTEALHFFSMVASAADASPIQVARAIKCRALLLTELRRFHEALEAYESLIERFGTSSEPALTEQTAMAMIEKGETLFALHRPDEARRAYEQVIERFEATGDAALRREVGRARNILYLRRGTLGSEEP